MVSCCELLYFPKFTESLEKSCLNSIQRERSSNLELLTTETHNDSTNIFCIFDEVREMHKFKVVERQSVLFEKIKESQLCYPIVSKKLNRTSIRTERTRV